MELDFVDNSDNVEDSTVQVLRYKCIRGCWGHLRHLGNGTGPNYKYNGPSAAMRHSVNVPAFAVSGTVLSPGTMQGPAF